MAKIEFSKGLPFEFLPKMACFQKHPILTKTKKFLKIGRLPKRKISVWNLYQILNFLFFSDFLPHVSKICSEFESGSYFRAENAWCQYRGSGGGKHRQNQKVFFSYFFISSESQCKKKLAMLILGQNKLILEDLA